MRATRLLPATLAVAALLLAGCGGGDDDPAADPPPPTTEGGTSAPDDTGETSAPADDVAEVGACTNDLAVAGSDADDGPVEVAMAITDDGPHPDNTVDSDGYLSGAIATYELEADPQFGLGIPVGVPEVPADGLIYTFTVSLEDAEDTIAAGDTFTDTAGDTEDTTGSIANHGLYSGTSGRINPLGDTTIEITEITDEQVCGTITAVAETEIQSFPTFTGTFTADRVQALEAEG